MNNYLVFDTNAFYNYMGREKIKEGWNSDIDIDYVFYRKKCKSNKYIDICCLMEVFTRFKNEKQSVKRIINFLISEKFNLINLTYKSYNIVEAVNLLNACINNENDSMYDKIMAEICMHKCKMEANWIYTIAAEVSLCYAIFLSKKIQDKQYEYALKEIYSLYAKGDDDTKIEKNKKLIEERLLDAYNNNEEKKEAKSIFYDTVRYYCLAAEFFYFYLKEYKNGTNPGDSSFYQKVVQEVEKAFPKSDDGMQFRDRLINEFKTDKNSYDMILSDLIEKFKDKIGELQKSYLREILNKLAKVSISEQSQGLKKNDIIDMLTLFPISRQISFKNKRGTFININFLLITFDDSLLKFLKTKKPKNYDFIKQFYKK